MAVFTGLGNVEQLEQDSAPTLQITLQGLTDELSSGGVNLYESREVLRQMKPVQSIPETYLHMGEENWTMPGLMRRPAFTGNYTWETSMDVNTEIIRLALPFDLFKNEITRIPIDAFRFFRFKYVTVRIQLNGTPMHSGRLAIYYQAGITQADYDFRYADGVNFVPTLDSQVLMDPSKSTIAEIRIPFNHPLGYLHLGGVEQTYGEEAFTHFLGYIRVRVFNKLAIGDGGSPNVNFNILSVVEGLEALVPQSKFSVTD
jgi:hypothetical protein